MKTARSHLALLPLILILVPTDSAARTKSHMGLRWDQIAQVVEGHEVEITTTSGTRLKGTASGVLADSLVVKRGKTSEHVPRSTVVSLVLTRSTRRWRWIGAIAGYTAVAAPVSSRSKFGGEALQGAIGLAALATATLGYALGREADRRRTLITILPDPPIRSQSRGEAASLR